MEPGKENPQGHISIPGQSVGLPPLQIPSPNVPQQSPGLPQNNRGQSPTLIPVPKQATQKSQPQTSNSKTSQLPQQQQQQGQQGQQGQPKGVSGKGGQPIQPKNAPGSANPPPGQTQKAGKALQKVQGSPSPSSSPTLTPAQPLPTVPQSGSGTPPPQSQNPTNSPRVQNIPISPTTQPPLRPQLQPQSQSSSSQTQPQLQLSPQIPQFPAQFQTSLPILPNLPAQFLQSQLAQFGLMAQTLNPAQFQFPTESSNQDPAEAPSQPPQQPQGQALLQIQPQLPPLSAPSISQSAPPLQAVYSETKSQGKLEAEVGAEGEKKIVSPPAELPKDKMEVDPPTGAPQNETKPQMVTTAPSQNEEAAPSTNTIQPNPELGQATEESTHADRMEVDHSTVHQPAGQTEGARIEDTSNKEENSDQNVPQGQEEDDVILEEGTVPQKQKTEIADVEAAQSGTSEPVPPVEVKPPEPVVNQEELMENLRVERLKAIDEKYDFNEPKTWLAPLVYFPQTNYPDFSERVGCYVDLKIDANFMTTQNTGYINNAIWGTDIYTDDSDAVAMLAHTGRYKITGQPPTHDICLTVKILPKQEEYVGSTFGPVVSRSWGADHDGVSFIIAYAKEIPHGEARRGLKRGRKQDWESSVQRKKAFQPNRINNKTALLANVQFSFSGEPWHSYARTLFENQGNDESQWTSSKLKTSVLVFENAKRRYELSCTDGHYRVVEVNPLLFAQQAISFHYPLKESEITHVVEKNLTWEDIHWNESFVDLKDQIKIQILRFHWISRS